MKLLNLNWTSTRVKNPFPLSHEPEMQPASRVEEAQGSSLEFLRPERAFGEVLTETGSDALFYHLKDQFGVTASDIFERPGEFAKALALMMGEYGAALLMKNVYNAARHGIS